MVYQYQVASLIIIITIIWLHDVHISNNNIAPYCDCDIPCDILTPSVEPWLKTLL